MLPHHSVYCLAMILLWVKRGGLEEAYTGGTGFFQSPKKPEATVKNKTENVFKSVCGTAPAKSIFL